jgi:hypothetical protein
MLSPERIAIANRAICSTFERTSIAWQAIPHWDVGDPAQVTVRSDTILTLAAMAAAPLVPPLPPGPLGVLGARPLPIAHAAVPFQLSVAQASAPTPDALLAAVIPRTAELAQQFDDAVLLALGDPAAAADAAGGAVRARTAAWFPVLAAPVPPPAPPAAAGILSALINGRQTLEDAGYRAASCLIASTPHFVNLSQWVGSNVATRGLLVGANANSLFRASALTNLVLPLGGGAAARNFMLMIGRRQEIANGEAARASAGEEAVDIAVSVSPSIEVVGDNGVGTVDLAVRIAFAVRFKDERAVIVFPDV